MRPFRPALLALAALAAAPAALALPHAQGSCAGGTYRVVRGDTLYSIARLCRSGVADLARANRLDSAARIAPGQVLRLRPAPTQPAPAYEGGEAEDGYRVVAGDTLFSLARWSRVSLAALLAANPGIEPEKLEIGDLVRLPQGAVRPDASRARERGAPRAAPSPRPENEDDEEKPDEEREPEPEGM